MLQSVQLRHVLRGGAWLSLGVVGVNVWRAFTAEGMAPLSLTRSLDNVGEANGASAWKNLAAQ